MMRVVPDAAPQQAAPQAQASPYDALECNRGIRPDVLKMPATDMYAVFSAVRGPDGYYDRRMDLLKNQITARVRGIVFFKDDCPGIYKDSPLTHDQFELLKSWIEGMWDLPGACHYLVHLLLALQATENHEIWGGYGQKLLDILRRP